MKSTSGKVLRWPGRASPLMATMSSPSSQRASRSSAIRTHGRISKPALAHHGGTYGSRPRQISARSRPIFPNTNAYVGFCASGTALGKKFDGDPRFWKIGDGRLYLNLNGDIQAESSKDIAGNIAKADSNWQRIRTVAADRL